MKEAVFHAKDLKRAPLFEVRFTRTGTGYTAFLEIVDDSLADALGYRGIGEGGTDPVTFWKRFSATVARDLAVAYPSPLAPTEGK